ncbi:MAG TPA: phosphatase PAP2 family protein [Candidatus Paceibacterota bacterium]|nr:phosphatase PAP2 family protein [Candidatus Paceibacterota bacterium]
MKELFYRLPENILSCFKGRNLLWQLLAFLLTYLLIITGADWAYFQYFARHTETRTILFGAAILGFFVPVFLPLVLFCWGQIKRDFKTLRVSFAITQAEILGWMLSSFYKIFTGRAHPDLSGQTDISHVFHFGFWQGGIFWGWPSSHTAVAFALAGTIFALFPRKRFLKILIGFYALYIGIGVGATIHWFSDFVAGAILGLIIGSAVGRSFHSLLNNGQSFSKTD